MSSTLSFDVALPVPYEAALDRVGTALKAEGFGILTRIDVDRTLKEKIGVEFRRYAILGACNPPLAHRALSHRADVGLLLPCNVTVEAAGEDRSLVRIGNPEALMATAGMEGDAELREVAAEARMRLQRAAQALAATAAA
ncbi:MAG TPA: DUF302 domain-containing protein [Gemmatimonadales bacterium]|nr:DUF302 domain-containing protein [Gemmatimonadales bacterium]